MAWRGIAINELTYICFVAVNNKARHITGAPVANEEFVDLGIARHH